MPELTEIKNEAAPSTSAEAKAEDVRVRTTTATPIEACPAWRRRELPQPSWEVETPACPDTYIVFGEAKIENLPQ
ncbi:hypothetical protein KR009_001714 [Drosophila setifemur]|nr:hypothetical protein KR009_001714 [Drosophila setifemur]